ncbi:UMP kinase [Candidatus Woesearchaeota archaeon]|nr:UMP kinase [Candidatus Woesearchaeota archaeon]
MKPETLIISVGGSLICPDNIDIDFLRKFKEIILKHISKGKRFVLIAGGGRIARNYQAAAKELGSVDNEDLDWLGIHATRINAHLLRTIFKEHAHFHVNHDPTKKEEFTKSILVASGWKPGCSTDYDAVLLAKQLGVRKVINLSNTDYVYDRDPKQFPDAKPLKKIKWKDFRKLVGDEWSPGLNAPFDPVASNEAEEAGITVFIINGAKLDNLEKAVDGKKFVGTIIS